MHRFPLLWQRALSPPVTQVTSVASISFSFVPHSPLCSPWGFPWTVYLGWVVAGDALSSVAAAHRLPWWADLFLTCPPPTLTPNPSRPGLPWPTPPFAPASCPGNRREAWPGASLGPCLVPGHPCVRPRCMSKRFVLTSHYFLSRPSGGGATPLLAFVLFSSRKFFAADVAHGCPPRPSRSTPRAGGGVTRGQGSSDWLRDLPARPWLGQVPPVTTDPPEARPPTETQESSFCGTWRPLSS